MTKEQLYQIEIKKSNAQQQRFAHYDVPGFDFGFEYLDSNVQNADPSTFIQSFVHDWFQNPKKYLHIPTSIHREVQQKHGFITFSSILNESQQVRFKYNPQPLGSPGRKVALIHVMHWNGRLEPYERIINFIRSTGLPISTLIHIPAGRGLNPGFDCPVDYDMLSPNVGKVVFRTRQDVCDLQYLAKYLKEELNFEQVGLFTYSIGSLRGMLASMNSPSLFDFAIFHLIADDFTEAVMKGVSTSTVANGISGNISYELLDKLWSTISPGAYAAHFASLPKYTRVIQCEHDYVFGCENVRRFNEKLKNKRNDIELEVLQASHTTLGHFPHGPGVMYRNVSFIYRHTLMKHYKRSFFFI